MNTQDQRKAWDHPKCTVLIEAPTRASNSSQPDNVDNKRLDSCKQRFADRDPLSFGGFPWPAAELIK